MIEQLMLDTMYDLPSRKDSREFVITGKHIRQEEPIVARSLKGSKKQKGPQPGKARSRHRGGPICDEHAVLLGLAPGWPGARLARRRDPGRKYRLRVLAVLPRCERMYGAAGGPARGALRGIARRDLRFRGQTAGVRI